MTRKARRTLRFSLLSATLLSVQIFLLQHTYQHITPPSGYDCEICAHTGFLDHPVSYGDKALSVFIPELSFRVFSFHIVLSKNPEFYFARAPPLAV